MSNTIDRINKENSKRAFERAREHSGYEDQKENKRKLIDEYNSILGVIGKSHETYSYSHKDRILRMAKLLDLANYIKKEKICAKICKDLSEFGIKIRYVQKILPDGYKDQSKVRGEIWRPRAPNQDEEGQKQPLLITNNGETETETVDQKPNPLDEIHGGKSLEQMKREVEIRKTTDDKIDEEMQETLENPYNSNNTGSLHFLTDIPPEIREKLAAFDSMKLAFEEQKAISDKKSKDVFNLKRENLQLKSSIIANANNNKDSNKDSTSEIAQLKKKLTYLETELAEIDKESLQRDFQFKEVEIFKIHPDMITTLLDTSRRSQRTLFLVVHPKTMQIKDLRTDVKQHQIQARRNAGVAV
jgi:hypothetical protein